ncbi:MULTISPECIES: DUF3054 domain-containing protein [unclassified Nocardioides]|uniref:DUF3054 domain-containing protein n=1 Tax=unclassified Nocardioides TaxID=2615069 RepID=UPI0006FCA659|nr:MULTISPECIES: DUF3054 domain-containing protein [unclassified Nocardioides]KQY64490.1 hypothetical protein ASD30_06085 [Nocardioides sp. Root140]KQZ70414.1 hypothetical protein ASD66_12415 [Nocardioides sp. Root151]KRF18275.1 hypothetical protein ASH02_01555 [Nocardioides sp. Soil796]
MSRRALTVLALDLVLVIVFAAIGRAEHDKGNVVVGVLDTAWPFLAGVLVGWLLVRQLGRREATDIGSGITVVVSAVVIGMLLRVVTGDGTAFSFIVVATIVLGVLLIGSRAVHGWALARAARQGAGYSATDE